MIIFVFGIDTSSSVHTDNKKKKGNFIPGKGPAYGLDNIMLTAEKATK